MQQTKEKNFKTLLEIFNEELQQLPFKITFDKIESFITADKKSAEFINTINFGDNTLFENLEYKKISQCRARHSAISFLMGIAIGKFKNILNKCSTVLTYDINCLQLNKKDINYRLWMVTSINHDYGYYSNYLSKKINISDLNISYYLLNGESNLDYIPLTNYSEKYKHVLKNNYDQIIAYYEYSQRYHEKNQDSEEKNDHGILGALLVYDRVLRHSLIKEKIGCDMYDILLYKTACLTIAQHNIFKSNSKDTDKLYGEKLAHLYHDSNYMIDNNYVLLYLLSIVDTLECVKTFSKSENQTNYFETVTILKNVEIDVTDDCITINFSNLYEKINNDKPELLNKIDKHIENIKGLAKWTDLKVQETEDKVLEIK